jgi:translation initiation factor 2B subunit (eIF-2B alpha/beta/delta family)
VAVICQRAQEHIHAGECILTYGYSKIVEQFLKAAGAKRKFQVL